MYLGTIATYLVGGQAVNMDLQIVFSSILSFVLFFILHVYIFSRIDHSKVLIWIVKTCMIGTIFPLLFALLFSFYFPVFGSSALLQFVVVYLVSFLLYSLLSIGYVLGMFGLLESSLRIRILEKIASRGKEGISKKDINALYKNDVIIAKRLKRFVRSGDISYKNGLYTMKRRFSYFVVHAFIFESMKKIYLSKK